MGTTTAKPAAPDTRSNKSAGLAIARLDISGFRGFLKYSLSGFSRVNLIVGQNNSGKTTLLEALQLVAKSTNVDAVIRLLVDSAIRRGEVVQDANGVTRADLSHALHGHEPILGSGFELISSINPTSSVSCRLLSGSELIRSGRDDISLSERVEASFGIGLGVTADGIYEDFPLMSSGLFPPDLRTWSPPWVNRSDAGAILLPLRGFDAARVRRLWDDVMLESREDNVIDAMRLIEPRVKSISVLTQQGSQASAMAGVMLGLEGYDRKLPLGSMGEGMKCLFEVALAIGQSRGGALLIDEVDTGIHYSVMPDMWHFLLRAARVSGIQLFCTTHSLDCVRGLDSLRLSDPELFNDVSVHLLDRRLPTAVSLHGRNLSVSLEQHLEMRG